MGSDAPADSASSRRRTVHEMHRERRRTFMVHCMHRTAATGAGRASVGRSSSRGRRPRVRWCLRVTRAGMEAGGFPKPAARRAAITKPIPHRNFHRRAGRKPAGLRNAGPTRGEPQEAATPQQHLTPRTNPKNFSRPAAWMRRRLHHPPNVQRPFAHPHRHSQARLHHPPTGATLDRPTIGSAGAGRSWCTSFHEPSQSSSSLRRSMNRSESRPKSKPPPSPPRSRSTEKQDH